MPDVQRAGHVRRRLGHHELPGPGRRFLGGREGAALQPALVDPRFDGGSVVARGKLAVRRRHRHGRTPHPGCRRTPKTRSPKDERVPRGTTFVSTLTVSVLNSRAIGRNPSGSRATFSLSCPGALSALSAHPLYEADGGVLLTVVAVRGSLAQPPAAAPMGRSEERRVGEGGGCEGCAVDS